MWIFDSYYRGCVELWGKKHGLTTASVAYPQSFYLHFNDPHCHWELIEGLQSRHSVNECRFRTIYGELDGYKVYANRNVADRIEKQTGLAAELYNVDVRHDQRYLAESDLFPCGWQNESRFDPDFQIPLSQIEVVVRGDPSLDKEISCVGFRAGRIRRLEGNENTVISDLLNLIKAHDPDVILFPFADTWVHLIVKRAKRLGLDLTLSRSGWFNKIASRSYWSYGKMNYKDGAMIPDGRILIDTAKSFTYQEGGLKGVLLASRLTGLSPNLASRFTPGTLISSYEVFEALRRGIAVPFRKKDPERLRGFQELKDWDKGGMIFQPDPGVYEKVHELDFTSLYPSIIVKYNLSPETLKEPDKKGFLSTVLAPLLALRIETKKRKKVDPEFMGIDSVLKWMLVTCFGYTGYRNAKFGQIEVHEHITYISRDLLMKVKEIAESLNFQVLHGIVDCLWVRGEPLSNFKEAIESETGILTEVESFDWIVFLPLADGLGAYNRYFGRLSDGKMKVRGVMARRRDTPQYIRRMQEELFRVLSRACSLVDLHRMEPELYDIRKRYLEGLVEVDVNELVIRRRLSRLSYSRKCPEASAVQAHLRCGFSPVPGMEIGYVVKDASQWMVDAEWNTSQFDHKYYEMLLEKAWSEIGILLEQVDYGLKNG
ncbi:MAG: type B DNA-directed DNA polymerase [Methanotrichaceae archaeon]|nr:type B DNA-directed DNA polymerase [Methanotrichaceae archaeon]